MPRLFLACSTKIVTMATLRGQPSKEKHCEHRNSRALSSKKEEGSEGGFPTGRAGASPHTPQAGPQAAVYQGQPGRPSLALCSQEEWRNENLWGVEGRTGDSRGFRFVLLFVFFQELK